MQVAYMQSPHFRDIYNAIMFNKYPKHKRAIEKLHQAMLSQYAIQGRITLGSKSQYCVYPHQRLIYSWTSITLHCWENTQELLNVTRYLGKEYTVPICPIMLDYM